MSKKTDQKLDALSYYSTGGLCSVLYEPESIIECQDALSEIKKDNLPLFVLGGGTNSLVSDQLWEGAVLSFRKMDRVCRNGSTLVCGAGVENSVLSHFAYQEGLKGLSWMYRLPGQLGGTVRMNARCYGGEISQVVKKVTALDEDGSLNEFINTSDSQKVFKGYKDTVFMNRRLFIVSVELGLNNGAPDKIMREMRACEDDRVGKGQFDYPSCGCVFKNDYRPEVSVPSGMLLESVGAFDWRQGGAFVNPKHCNFIFNQGATSRDILELSLKMREAVWEEFGVWLSYEMEILGTLPEDLEERVLEKRHETFKNKKLEALRLRFRNRV